MKVACCRFLYDLFLFFAFQYWDTGGRGRGRYINLLLLQYASFFIFKNSQHSIPTRQMIENQRSRRESERW
jgi:hypothetical protein